jgi:hypothetical protein
MSEECKNECGRKLTDEIKEEAKKRNYYLSMAKFCEDLRKPKEKKHID